jgi:DNA-binding NarL/FixJ family response regulator
VRIFIVFRDKIYASGLQASLATVSAISSVHYASSIPLAWEDEALAEADVVLLDSELAGAGGFVQEITIEGGARVLVCLREPNTAAVLDAIANGAGGAIARDRLTPDSLLAAVTAVAAGICALDTVVLRTLAAAVSPPRVGAGSARTDRDAAVRGDRISVARNDQFSARELLVLSLIASGLSNREIAQRLSYSERTIKTILHDVINKLGVKSRSQAVAMAVREQMI